MHRVDELHIGITQGEFSQSQADPFKALAEVFPAMAGDQHHPLVFAQLRQRRVGRRLPLAFVQVLTHP
ncbi:hypothetical protein D3C77_818410 [compost metagenome]